MTGGFQVLHLVRPLLGFLPEVQSATRKIPFREKLGITPIVTSGMVMQLLVGSKIIEVDNIVREDRALLNGAQKLLGILIAIGEAVAYAPSGMYDNVNQLETGNAILIILQLFLVGHSVPVGGLAYYVLFLLLISSRFCFW
jgi:protein transport protein SEC61 subunit alpha